ncbi:Peptide methionine sulfoxide reductase B3, chloroplastic [Symbiodinium microadriaticum]|uniref:Peptide methionine sulfoxide reductase B3, chloroplastic n=1 Tax=Symbiodinium microadriaticum TaxID=2951 RepID=A0A1Q9CTL3_SYMMI|nr:Peptide methionine sulfoxide reductase B3, chloroplastic [Symbiodinium microadriaticum]
MNFRRRVAQAEKRSLSSLNFSGSAAAVVSAVTAFSAARGTTLRSNLRARHVTMAAKTVQASAYLQTKVEEMVALQPVMLFSKSWCPFCTKAKEAMKQQGIRFATCELDTLGEEVEAEVQDILLGITGARTVPRVFVGGNCIGGGTDTQNLAADGSLKKMVDEAMETYKNKVTGAVSFQLQKSDEEWQSELGTEKFRILRRRGTERPGSHKYDKFLPEAGHFSCAGCGLPLYSASSKFASNCGWPVFDKCYASDDLGQHVVGQPDGSGALEIVCTRCGSHLGHVFYDSVTEANPNGGEPELKDLKEEKMNILPQ